MLFASTDTWKPHQSEKTISRKKLKSDCRFCRHHTANCFRWRRSCGFNCCTTPILYGNIWIVIFRILRIVVWGILILIVLVLKIFLDSFEVSQNSLEVCGVVEGLPETFRFFTFPRNSKFCIQLSTVLRDGAVLWNRVRNYLLSAMMGPVSLYQVTHCPFSCGV